MTSDSAWELTTIRLSASWCSPSDYVDVHGGNSGSNYLCNGAGGLSLIEKDQAGSVSTTATCYKMPSSTGEDVTNSTTPSRINPLPR